MRKIMALSTVVLAGALAAASASAQGSTGSQGGMPGMQMPMQQGQGGMSCCPCPMMQRAAAVENRLRQLEERAGVPAPVQPDAPATPH